MPASLDTCMSKKVNPITFLACETSQLTELWLRNVAYTCYSLTRHIKLSVLKKLEPYTMMSFIDATF